MLVRYNGGLSGSASAAPQGPRRDPVVANAPSPRGGTNPMRPVLVHALHERDGHEAARLHDVGEDAVDLFRDHIVMPEFVLRPFAFDERDDAAFVRVVAMDDLAPDGDTHDVRA